MRIERKRSAIEHLLILPAHQIDPDDRQPCRLSPCAQAGNALRRRAHAIRRRSGREQQLRPGGTRRLGNALRLCIRADGDSAAHPFDVDHANIVGRCAILRRTIPCTTPIRPLARRKVTLCISSLKIEKIWKAAFVAGGQPATFPQQGRRVKTPPFVHQRMADEQQDARRFRRRRQGFERGIAGCIKILAQQQIFRRIAAQRQFRRQ